MNEPSSSRSKPIFLSETQFSEDWCKRRHVPSCSPFVMLKEREIGIHLTRRAYKSYLGNRDFYSTIPLKRNFVGFEPSNRYSFLGWSPDGKYAVAMHCGMKALRIYKYLGVERGLDAAPEDFLQKSLELVSEMTLPYEGHFKQDGLYFTSDSRHFVIVCIAALRGNEAGYNLDRVYSHNESLPLSALSIDDYTFLSYALKDGQISGVYQLLADRVSLTHGANVCGRYLMITSHHQQVIHVVQIASDTGSLVPLRIIGYTIHDDDAMYLYGDLHDSYLRTDVMSGFKQRLNSFLFKRAKTENKVADFLRGSVYRDSLRMDRVGLFEDFYLMIRMLPMHMIINSNEIANRDPNLLPCFFVIMDWRNAEILEVYENYDTAFMALYEEAPESLVFPMSDVCWPGASQFRSVALQCVNRYRKRIRSQSDVRRRVINQLPMPSLHANKVSLQSPYLDPSIFQIEDRFQMKMLCGKTQVEYQDYKEIKIGSKRTKRLFHRLPFDGLVEPIGRQVSLLFHPTDPLCIAIDRQRPNPTCIVYIPKHSDLHSDDSLSCEETPKSTEPESSETSSQFESQVSLTSK
ncbi:unnamed protein product [Auanema sp. JU1783]|nr:unnamed protein product [Auanema sp. JU1783]